MACSTRPAMMKSSLHHWVRYRIQGDFPKYWYIILRECSRFDGERRRRNDHGWPDKSYRTCIQTPNLIHCNRIKLELSAVDGGTSHPSAELFTWAWRVAAGVSRRMPCVTYHCTVHVFHPLELSSFKSDYPMEKQIGYGPFHVHEGQYIAASW